MSTGADRQRKYRANHPWGERDRCKSREYCARRKAKVFDYYGYICVGCGETDPVTLTIDHINGGGNKHRKENGLMGGSNFYLYLIKNNFPKGFRTLCMNCQFRARVGKPLPNDKKP